MKSRIFWRGVGDLTASACEEFNRQVPDREGIYYQSVGLKVKPGGGGKVSP